MSVGVVAYSMHVGIVSDTHDNLDIVEGAVSQFRAEEVDAVVHCGDVVAPFSATPFDVEGVDFYAVRGNNDGEWKLRAIVEEFGSYLGECGELTFDGLDVAVYHGTSEALTEALCECGRYDFVFSGHTHERVLEDRGPTTHVNPGGLPLRGANDEFSVAILDTDEESVVHRRL